MIFVQSAKKCGLSILIVIPFPDFATASRETGIRLSIQPSTVWGSSQAAGSSPRLRPNLRSGGGPVHPAKRSDHRACYSDGLPGERYPAVQPVTDVADSQRAGQDEGPLVQVAAQSGVWRSLKCGHVLLKLWALLL